MVFGVIWLRLIKGVIKMAARPKRKARKANIGMLVMASLTIGNVQPQKKVTNTKTASARLSSVVFLLLVIGVIVVIFAQ